MNEREIESMLLDAGMEDWFETEPKISPSGRVYNVSVMEMYTDRIVMCVNYDGASWAGTAVVVDDDDMFSADPGLEKLYPGAYDNLRSAMVGARS